VLPARLVSWLSVGALVALGTVSAVLSVAYAPGSSSEPSQSPAIQVSEAGFAGYDFNAAVGEVAASITVPQISSVPSPFGTASTWIGAQNAAGSFVQLGITEYEDATSSWVARRDPILQAFWSDTDEHFHPVPIADVRAGDRVSVKMTQKSSGWTLRFRDLTRGWTRTVVTDYAPGQLFTLSEWVQEDPVSSADPLHNLPYPELSQVTFSGVEVDGITPQMSEADARAMDVPGGPFLVPTEFEAGTFRVVPATSYARQYLSDISRYDLQEEIFAFALQSDPAAKTRVVSACVPLIRALDTLEDGLAGQSWPSDAQTDIHTLLYHNDLLSEALRDLVSGDVTSALETTILRDQLQIENLSEVVRADLGLPPPP
jgi:hypothetical protein